MALVVNIQKYSIHDGPGIRTTIFFKGCPLLCPWCHNPESQVFRQELAWQKDRCINCGDCLSLCPKQAISRTPGGLVLDRESCDLCGACAESCPALAWELLGRDYSLEELLAEIEQDRVFYEQSGGGVTLSGGEPLSQGRFAIELLRQCKARGLHTAVDTCGFVPRDIMAAALPATDLFLYDIKHLDPEGHMRYMQAPVQPIVDNLRFLAANGAEIWLRLPLIPGINDSPSELAAVAELARDCGLRQIFLLPYHKLAAAKYARLGLVYQLPGLEEPEDSHMEELRRFLAGQGLDVHIGG